MRFRLIYDGELRASQVDPVRGEKQSLSEHKQQIRKVFHWQLKQLWAKNWFLSTHRVFPRDYGIDRPAADTAARWGASDNEMISLLDAVAQSHIENGYRFTPLVRQDWRLLCSLDILFLRRDPPGSVVHAGDLDNRLKTLIDALRKPEGVGELRGNELPGDGEDPFFCLLEDDKLVNGLRVEADRLLSEPSGNRDEDRRRVHIVITADVRPYDVTNFNLSFA
jgi:hypothetical protein